MDSEMINYRSAETDELRLAVYRQEIFISQLFCLGFDVYYYEIILDDIQSALKERQLEAGSTNGAI